MSPKSDPYPAIPLLPFMLLKEYIAMHDRKSYTDGLILTAGALDHRESLGQG